MNPEQGNSALSISTSTTQRAIEGSAFCLNQEAVTHALQEMDLPENADIEIVGDLEGLSKGAGKAGETTFHYIAVLPTMPKTIDELEKMSLYKMQRNCASYLIDIVESHKNESKSAGWLEKHGTSKRNLTDYAGLGLMSSYLGYFSWKGAEAVPIDHLEYGSIPSTATMAAFTAHGIYRMHKYKREAEKYKKEIDYQDSRRVQIDKLAKDLSLIIPRETHYDGS